MSEVVHILDGAIALYQREKMGALTWTARYKIKGHKGYVVRTTGERDLKAAKEIARETFYELTADYRRGIAIHGKTFTKAVEAYRDDLASAVALGKTSLRTQKDNNAVIDRYLLPYFKNRPIDAIKQDQIEAYKTWRLNYWVSGPGSEQETREYMRDGRLIKARMPKRAQTQRSGEILVLKGIFKAALRRKWLTRDQIPDIEEDARESARRPAFSPSEWKRVEAAMDPYIKSANGPVVQHDRKMLCAYMRFMFETGLRPGKEHQQLTWADCELIEERAQIGNRKVTYIHVRDDTKTGKRLAVSSEDTWSVLQQIRLFSPWTKPTDPVFADKATGKAIKSFARGMGALLKTVGLEKDRHGDNFSPYSLRHTYATDRLINGRVDVWLLAKNMGTSVEMIRKHYGHDEPQQRSEELTHDKQQLDMKTWMQLLTADPALADELLRRSNVVEDPQYNDEPSPEPDPNKPKKPGQIKLSDML